MTEAAIHKLVLPIVRKAVARGATAKELVSYFEAAAAGMRINASFGLKGSDLIDVLRHED